MNPCIAIPIFDHGSTIPGVVASLERYDLPCLVVDDGSGEDTRRVLERLEERFAWVEVVHHVRNRGKGAALRTAYERAAERGRTHVVQLDADGQHDASDIPLFLAAAKAQPDALILGVPIFDESIPWHRLHGRKLSQGIVWLETRSRSVRDPLCGFRCVPLVPTLEVLAKVQTEDRMGFDPELIIRLVRAGVPIVSIPTSVHYPESGLSHFRMLEDNLLIAWMYIRLALGIARPNSSSSPKGEKLVE